MNEVPSLWLKMVVSSLHLQWRVLRMGIRRKRSVSIHFESVSAQVKKIILMSRWFVSVKRLKTCWLKLFLGGFLGAHNSNLIDLHLDSKHSLSVAPRRWISDHINLDTALKFLSPVNWLKLAFVGASTGENATSIAAVLFFSISNGALLQMMINSLLFLQLALYSHAVMAGKRIWVFAGGSPPEN